jgi:DNA polymerase (family 10)
MVLLHGSELNIGPGGEVDWDADFLASFDICIASVHTQFRQPREQMTSRLIRACRNPYVNVIGHLTTRLIGRRPPIEADFDAVFAAAAATGTALEVNSFPDRLDVNDELILRARRHGVKFAINSDAHSTGQLRLQRYDDVINTWPLPRLRDFLLAKRPG